MVGMSTSPFSARPTSPEGERRRARIIVAIATAGIVATLLAYAISPGVRHAVGHAAHSVKHAVGHVFDPDEGVHRGPHVHLVAPLRPPGLRRTTPTGQARKPSGAATAPPRQATTATTTAAGTTSTAGAHAP